MTGITLTVRLFGGANSYLGRLEVNYNGVWGTVCDDGFTDAAASVVCRSLNFMYVLHILGALCLFYCLM